MSKGAVVKGSSLASMWARRPGFRAVGPWPPRAHGPLAPSARGSNPGAGRAVVTMADKAVRNHLSIHAMRFNLGELATRAAVMYRWTDVVGAS